MILKFLFYSLLLACLLAGCSLTGQTGPTPTALPEGMLFYDDFSNQSGDWAVDTFDQGGAEYTQDAFRVYINEANFMLWTNPDRLSGVKDVRLEVEATKTAGPEASDMGLICRYRDEKNFYFFTVSSDGYYALWKMKEGAEAVIGGENQEVNTQDIKSGGATNSLRLDCVGNTLTGYANGVQLIQADDSEFADGNVGLIAGVYDEPGADIRFDNFVVYQPTP